MASPASLIGALVLICLSALFSGLTLGLMGLDKMGLQIVIESGQRAEASARERRDAKLAQDILPFRSRGNLLLCTLLFGNVAVNCLLSILMADLTSGLAGFLISTLSIVVFGEIVPQSVCSRHPLAIGSACIPLVYFFVVVTFFVSYPTSLLLDYALGQDMGTVYSRNQLKGMLEMYAKTKEADFGQEETKVMAGVVDFSQKNVGACMTPLRDVFMVDIEAQLNFETILSIFQSGHSRIPVYERAPAGSLGKEQQQVVGLLFVKELVLVDPEDSLPVRTICHHWFGRDIPIVFCDCKLSVVMQVFKSGRSHMALVKDVVTHEEGDPYYITVGIITLEDLLEEILQEELYDESDVHVVTAHSRKAEKNQLAAGGAEMPADHPLLLYLEAKQRQEKVLPAAEVSAVASFLRDTLPSIFGEHILPRASLEHLITVSPVRKALKGELMGDPLYAAGQESSTFTLVLEGNLDVAAGEDGFLCPRGPWSSFGQRILAMQAPVRVDFTATVNTSQSTTRLLQIDLAHYMEHKQRSGGESRLESMERKAEVCVGQGNGAGNASKGVPALKLFAVEPSHDVRVDVVATPRGAGGDLAAASAAGRSAPDSDSSLESYDP